VWNLHPPGDMRWSVVAQYRNPTNIEPVSQVRTGAAAPTDVATAKAALNGIGFGQEALNILSEVVWPGSSSSFRMKARAFVVVMSGEPQGALKIRQREPTPTDGFEPSPFRGWAVRLERIDGPGSEVIGRHLLEAPTFRQPQEA